MSSTDVMVHAFVFYNAKVDITSREICNRLVFNKWNDTCAVGFHNVEVDLTSKIVSTNEETLHRCVLCINNFTNDLPQAVDVLHQV